MNSDPHHHNLQQIPVATLLSTEQALLQIQPHLPLTKSIKSLEHNNHTSNTNTNEMQFSTLATLILSASAAAFATPLDLEKRTNEKANEYTSTC